MAKNKKPEEGKKGLPEWQATYGDMVTLLLCFFVLMFATSSVDAEKFKQIAASFSKNSIIIMPEQNAGMLDALGNGIIEMPIPENTTYESSEQAEKIKNELQDIAENFKEYLEQNNIKDKIEVIIDELEKSVILSFKDGILFDSGKANIKQNAINILNLVSKELLKYPENQIKIEGHTDNVPISTDKYPNNWYLSAARAISVATYLIEQKQFNPGRISTEGYGEHRPRVSNDTPENRAINRRVEIKIISKEA